MTRLADQSAWRWARHAHEGDHIGLRPDSERTSGQRQLNDDLVRQARLYTRNLSGTLEDLLAEFVARERVRRRDEDAALDRVVAALGAFHDEHGLSSDEFTAL